ncbi:hypothetical protein KJ951_03650 [Patescibacteria group bacterium]|nr:hypothetical protein [Patescibacteria group bacterium]MBU1703472.1 hypothetical protein [Patescibacteria group bacterium]MBU1953446.1 hypothetical protein [Patescibacteria group bacterium]
MFGFGKKKKKQQENQSTEDHQKAKKSHTEKLVMGTIIGVAVGSVIGISLNQKSKQETGEQQKSLKAPEPKTETEPEEQEEQQPRSHIGKLLHGFMKGKKDDSNQKKHPVSAREQLKKIPTEWD